MRAGLRGQLGDQRFFMDWQVRPVKMTASSGLYLHHPATGPGEPGGYSQRRRLRLAQGPSYRLVLLSPEARSRAKRVRPSSFCHLDRDVRIDKQPMRPRPSPRREPPPRAQGYCRLCEAIYRLQLPFAGSSS